MVAPFKCIHLMRLNCTDKINSDGKFYVVCFSHTKYDLMKKVYERFGTVLGKNEVSR